MGKKKSRMYALAKTWSPFKGCYFACSYCIPSFQQICKLYNKCFLCQMYVPHEHPERLKMDKIPNAKIIFVAGNGDIYFANPRFVKRIIEAIKERNKKHPKRIYYFQSKNPLCLGLYLDQYPDNVILVTTLETNRDEGYAKISRAPMPSIRFRAFKKLKWKRKVVTIEPVMDFDEDIFFRWIDEINPEYIWIGYNSRPKAVQLPEPSKDDLEDFIKRLRDAGFEVRGKDLRGLE